MLKERFKRFSHHLMLIGVVMMNDDDVTIDNKYFL